MKKFSVDDKISPRSATLCMAMCAFLWSTSGALVKYIEWSGIVINFMRSIIAGVILCIYLRVVGKKLVVNRNTLIAAGFVCVKYSAFILGNKLTSSATMIALQYTSPVFVLLFSFLFFKQKIRGKDMAVAVAAMAGIAMLTLDRTGPSSMAGNLMGLAVGVTTGLMYLFTSKGLDKEIKLNIKNRKYSMEELNQIYEATLPDKQEAKSAFIFNAVVTFLTLGYIMLRAIKDIEFDEDDVLYFCITLGIMAICFIFCLAVFYYCFFKRNRKQFLKALKKGYPELINKFK